MKKITFILFVSGLVIYVFLGTSIGCICPGLDGWHYKGDVYTSGCDKVLGDNNSDSSYLYKFDPSPRGQYRISFEFMNGLSRVPYINDLENFAFLDTFYATLYFVNSCSRFDLENCSCEYDLPLFDLDFTGPFNNHGRITPSIRGDGWSHFDMIFTNYFHKIIPTFELYDMNHVNGDSKVIIADLSISQVPIPGTILLFSSGLCGLFCLRKRKKKSRVIHNR